MDGFKGSGHGNEFMETAESQFRCICVPMPPSQSRDCAVCQFLQAGVRLSLTALDIGMVALHGGNRSMAEQQVVIVRKTCQTVSRFLPEVPNEESRRRLSRELDRIEECSEALVTALES